MKDRLINLLKEGKKSKEEIQAELGLTPREIRKLRSDINSDLSKEYENVFIIAHNSGGYTLATDTTEIISEFKLLSKKISHYFKIMAKINRMRRNKNQEHLF